MFSANQDHKTHYFAKKALNTGLKIGLGSSLAAALAAAAGLGNPVSAATITLLTLMSTRLDQVELVLQRLVSFLMTILIALAISWLWQWNYISFAVFLFLVAFLTERLGWSRTLSVNALIGMHFLQAEQISVDFVLNECKLVFLGMLIAIVFNQFFSYKSAEVHIFRHIRRMDREMQNVLALLESYIRGEEVDPWQMIHQMEKDLELDLMLAKELAQNTFSQAASVYVKYFQLRQKQLAVVSSLHHQIRKVRSLKEADMVADYVHDIIPFIYDRNIPEAQIKVLQSLVVYDEKELAHLDAATFKDKAVVYHVLDDLEAFLRMKQQFLNDLSDQEQRLFFKNRHEK